MSFSNSYRPPRSYNSFGSSSRGGYKAGYSQANQRYFQEQKKTPETLYHGLEEELASIPLEDGNVVNSEVVRINGVKAVASYNFVEGKKELTLAIPGSPLLFDPPPLPFRTQRAHEDDLASRKVLSKSVVGAAPFESIVVPVRTLHPNYNFHSFDFITERNNLRKLLTAIAEGDEAAAFRIDVDVLESEDGKRGTVLLGVWDDLDKQERGMSYRKTFFQKVTTRANRSWSDHHNRIVSYNFEGLTMLVRAKISACDASLVPNRSQPNNQGHIKSGGENNLAGLLEKLSLDSDHQPSGNHPVLEVERTGNTMVPQASLLEVRARARYLEVEDFRQVWAQIFLAAVPKFCIAKHDRGRFSEIKWIGLEDDNQGFEFEKGRELAKRDLKKLAGLLKKIKSISVQAKQRGEGSLSLVFEKGELKVYERDNGRRLVESFDQPT